jgi:hypothetical protein
VATPTGPWRNAVGIARQAVRGDAPGDRGFFLTYDRALTAYDRTRSLGYYWLDTARRDPWDERASPLSPIFGVWLAERDVHMVHAGAVGSESGCVLLAGAPGSGKSHVALASVQAGHRYVGDDACLLVGETPTLVRSIYSSAQAAPLTQENVPFLSSMTGDTTRTSGRKALVFLYPQLPGVLLREAPLRAIVICSAANGPDTAVRRASPGEALLALAPRPLLDRPGVGSAMLRSLSHMAQRVPCVRLAWGLDPSGISGAVTGLLEGG